LIEHVVRHAVAVAIRGVGDKAGRRRDDRGERHAGHRRELDAAGAADPAVGRDVEALEPQIPRGGLGDLAAGLEVGVGPRGHRLGVDHGGVRAVGVLRGGELAGGRPGRVVGDRGVGARVADRVGAAGHGEHDEEAGRHRWSSRPA
jgi:hypothetical protein